jgi:hypothetical protein
VRNLRFVLAHVLYAMVSAELGVLAAAAVGGGGNAGLLAAVSALLAGLGTGGVTPVDEMGFLGNISWARWYGEAVTVVELDPAGYASADAAGVARHLELRYAGYRANAFGRDCLVLAIFWLVMNLIGAVAHLWVARRVSRGR